MERQVAIDLGWLLTLKDRDFWGHYNREFEWSETRPAPNEHVKNKMFARALEKGARPEMALFLEQAVLNDALIVDKVALDAANLSIEPEFMQVIQLRTAPDSVYRDAETTTRQLAGPLLDAQQPSLPLRSLADEMSNPGPGNVFFSGYDKLIFDGYFRKHIGTRRFVDSGDTLERAIFYLEFSRHLGDVPFLSGAKRVWLERINLKMKESLHEVLVKKMDSGVLSELMQDIPDAFESKAIPFPPVAELIYRKAIDKGMPLWDATMEIRESPQATDYRKLLDELKISFSQGRKGKLDTQNSLKGLARLAEQWMKHGNSQYGVTVSKRTLKLDKLPYIGDLLAAASMSEVQIRDLILDKPPGYVAFISSWYAS